MKKALLIAALLTAAATPAYAAPVLGGAVITFGTLGTPGAGETLYANYDNLNPAPSGGLLQISGPNGIPGQAAPVGSGNFGYVVGGSGVSYSFGPTTSFSFDAGSIDAYNSVQVSFANGGSEAFAGTFGAPAGSDQRLQFAATGSLITGFTLQSGQNSFEFDNIATGATVTGAVPEPATWAMMLVGFGLIGFGLRRRSKVSTTVRFA